MVKRILVALSGTPFTGSAIEHAIELARRHDAEVTGVTIIDAARLEDVGPIPLGGATAAHDLAEHRREITRQRIDEVVADFESSCRGGGVTHGVVRETGDPFEELISLWRYHDLTVIGLRGLFEYGVVHNPDDLIVRMISRGVRPILAVAEQHRAIKRVLVAYNGSLESAKAMKRFVQAQLWPDVAIKIACFGFEDDDAQSLLPAAASYCRAHGFEPEVENVESDPKEGLLKHAEDWGADLVVMGATSRSKIARFILGDTALHAMQHAKIPLYLTQ
jgi:nucleotide-binding universal stress UspA family protein